MFIELTNPKVFDFRGSGTLGYKTRYKLRIVAGEDQPNLSLGLVFDSIEDCQKFLQSCLTETKKPLEYKP